MGKGNAIRALFLATATLLAAIYSSSLIAPAPAEATDRFVLKYACFAPEGSTYVRAMRAWDAELRERSDGRLSFKIYPGGVQGDERDMLRKVRVGQLHMVGMTGIGLGEVLPAFRILEMPAFYRNYEEVDAATKAVEPALEALVREQRYELLGWGEAGTVHIFSNSPLSTLEDLSATKMWAWEGDRISTELFKMFGIGPVPLPLPNVLSSLQAGTIDGVYGSPLAVVALQWSSHIKYMTSQHLGRAMGGTVIDKRRFDAIPADLQALLKETGQIYHAQIVEGARAENDRAIATLKKQGVQSLEIQPAEWTRLEQGAGTVRQTLTGDMWSQQLLDTVESAVATVRNTSSQPSPSAPAPETGSLGLTNASTQPTGAAP